MADGYCYIICPDSTVSAMGYNLQGQLGDSTYFNKSTPVKVKHLKRITDVSAPGILALDVEGNVWRWSNHGYYQFYKIDITDVKAISSCHRWLGSVSFALKRDGTLWTWTNSNVISDGEWDEKTEPMQITGIPKVTSIKCSSTFSVFIILCEDGSVYTWGSSSANGNNTSYPNGGCPEIAKPTKVGSISGVKEIAAGTGTAYALKNDGTVWFWGWIKYGSCYPSYPEKININNVRTIVAEESGLYMIKNDGSLWGWGFNSEGELGVGNVYVREIPANVNNISNVSEISTDGYSGLSTLALTTDGTIYGWGYNYYGELGDSTHKRILFPKELKNTCPTIDCYEKYPNAITIKLDTFITMNSSVNLTSSPSALYNWQYGWHGYKENYENTQTFNAYIQNKGVSIFASLIDDEGCYRYEQFNLHAACDTLVKTKDTLMLDTTVFAGSSVLLRASDAKSYFWYPYSTMQENTLVISDDIESTVTLTDEYGCERIERFNIKMTCDSSTYYSPKIWLDTATYLGDKIEVTIVTDDSIRWQSNDGSFCIGCRTVGRIVDKRVEYHITIIDQFGCVEKGIATINIIDCDTIVLNEEVIKLDTIIQPGSVIKLNASAAKEYQWSPPNGLSCLDCQSPFVAMLKNTVYDVTLTDKYKCQWVEHFDIKNNCDSSSLNNPPLVMDSITYPNAILQLATKEGELYHWEPQIGLSCNSCQIPSVNTNSSIEYLVTGFDKFGCSFKEKFRLRIRDCDTIQLNEQIILIDTTLNYPSEVILLASESTEGYTWSPVRNLNCTDCQEPVLFADATQDYIVNISNEWHCPYSEVFKITLDMIEVVIPNVFTPNSDGINDYFEIIGIIPGTSLKIFDNNGFLLYNSDNYEGNWNGNDNGGNELKEGTYWYILNIPYYETFKGWVYIKR